MNSETINSIDVRTSTVAFSEPPPENYNWIELEFFTESKTFTAGISCPAGVRIIDLLNTPRTEMRDGKPEFIELEDRSNPYLPNKSFCIKNESILFVSAPDKNLRRGLGANGEFKVYPFIPKTAFRINIQMKDYLLTGNLFKTNGQRMIDVLNNSMFFLPLTDVTLSKNCVYLGNRPFIAVNKQQIVSATVE